MMSGKEPVEIQCPYCGEVIGIVVDCSVEGRNMRTIQLFTILVVSCGLAGCDTFREVHLAPRHDAGATLTAGNAKDADILVGAVRKVAAESKLTCIDDPKPGVRVACGPWFRNLSVTHTDSAPIIELHLAHPGGSFGHDPDCDQIDHWVRDLQAQLGEVDVSSTLGSC